VTPAKHQLLASATTYGQVHDTRDPDATHIAAWWLNRARRQWRTEHDCTPPTMTTEAT
jgi:hypothetical protein